MAGWAGRGYPVEQDLVAARDAELEAAVSPDVSYAEYAQRSIELSAAQSAYWDGLLIRCAEAQGPENEMEAGS